MTLEEEGRDRLEIMLEDEEPDGIDQASNEMDCSLRKVALALLEQLMNTFPKESFGLIHSLVQRLITDELHVDLKTKDSILSVLALLPHLYVKLDLDSKEWLNISVVLEWMAKKSKSKI